VLECDRARCGMENFTSWVSTVLSWRQGGAVQFVGVETFTSSGTAGDFLALGQPVGTVGNFGEFGRNYQRKELVNILVTGYIQIANQLRYANRLVLQVCLTSSEILTS